MAVPFRRVSSTRRDKRRTHDKLSAPAVVKCPECGEFKLAHRVCGHCGYYNGVKVKEISLFLFLRGFLAFCARNPFFLFYFHKFLV